MTAAKIPISVLLFIIVDLLSLVFFYGLLP
jgi:hypothetical protein